MNQPNPPNRLPRLNSRDKYRHMKRHDGISPIEYISDYASCASCGTSRFHSPSQPPQPSRVVWSTGRIFQRTVEKAAALIARDLGIEPGCDTSLSAIERKTHRYCHWLIEQIELPQSIPGYYTRFFDESAIFVRTSLIAFHPRAAATVLLHELVHCLLCCDDYAQLNDLNALRRDWTGWDQCAFHEAICRAVERWFVWCGGYDYRAELDRLEQREGEEDGRNDGKGGAGA